MPQTHVRESDIGACFIDRQASQASRPLDESSRVSQIVPPISIDNRRSILEHRPKVSHLPKAKPLTRHGGVCDQKCTHFAHAPVCA